VSSSLPGGDVRGFYARLGVELAGWAATEAAVSCFADPDAHRSQDRNRSCSVNLASGLWHCHGCGAAGGPYDAAIALNRSPREAMDLLIEHGLAERRPPHGEQHAARPRPESPRGARLAAADRGAGPVRPALAVTDRDIDGWRADLRRMRWPLRVMRAEHRSLWDRDTLLTLGLGFDHGRVIFPIRDDDGALQGVLRYAPTHERTRKMLATPGSTLGLIPHPAADQSEDVLLVEGPPDMLAARSLGWSAFAVPGDDAWQPEWAQPLAGRRVTIVMDADPPGRAAAVQIARDLAGFAAEVRIADLHTGRDDGADLTDWLIAHRGRSVDELRGLLAQATTSVSTAATDLPVDLPSVIAPGEALERYESVLGPALATEIARELPGAVRELHDADDVQLQALVAEGEAAWRALDQSSARQAVAVADERDRAAAVLAGVRASMQELASLLDHPRSPVAHESQLRDERSQLRERSDVLARRLATLDAQLAQLAVRDTSPERWARSHRVAFVHGLAARHVLTSREASQATTPSLGAHAAQRSQPPALAATDDSRALEDPSQPRARWEMVLADASPPLSVSRPANPAVPVARATPAVAPRVPRVRR